MADEGSVLGEVVVRTEGGVKDNEIAYARDKLARAARTVRGPVLSTKVNLLLHGDPARPRPAFVKAEVDLDGHVVRAHAAARTVMEAVDLMEERLRERVERQAHHEEAKHLRHRGEADEWHHGDRVESRPPYFPRPTEEREVVRRKTYAVGAQSIEEAVHDLEALDHDFFLFRNAATGEDNVLHRVADERYELLQPTPSSPGETRAAVTPSPTRPSAMNLEDATALLEAGNLPFVFFLDPTSGRGAVLYHRYDGHYGLVAPTAAP